MTEKRIERDSMGEFEVPVDAYYGAQTMRAVVNFPISDLRFPRSFIRALANVKLAAAHTNADLGLLDSDISAAIAAAAQEIAEGKLDSEFVVDIFQTGSGTSTNMNANEVISNRGHRDQGRSDRLAHPCPPERPREPGTVLQRRHTDRDAPRRAGVDPK